MRTSVKKAAALATVPMVLGPAAAVVTAAGPAGAVNGDYTGQGVAIRELPLLSSTRLGLGSTGQGVAPHCFKVGDTVVRNGIAYNLWDHHTNRTTGVTGFSSVAFLDYPGGTPNVPAC